jgi:glyoxylase-like metal-dependent hydrolase (beta-lactamase superfamily II)
MVGYHRDRVVNQFSVTVHRLGDKHVNFWAVADGARVTLVDVGIPGHWQQLISTLAALGYDGIEAVSAIVLTHAHFDHLGLAARIQQITGARIWVHHADAALAAQPQAFRTHAPSERPILPYLLRHPAAMKAPLHFAMNGALRTQGVTKVTTITGDGELDVPGQLRAIHTPGHTPGSTIYLLPAGAGAFTGDALVTHDEIGHHRGPSAICRGISHNGAQSLTSLHKMTKLDAAVVYPGHGEPTTNLSAAASTAADYGIR